VSAVGYKTVQDGERYYVVNEDSFGILREVTPNLADNERKITMLEVEDCPLGEPCLRLNDGIISVCTYLGAYPSSAMSPEGEIVVEELPCTHEETLGVHAVRALAVEDCPIGESNCLGCQHIKDIIVPLGPRPRKSHACLVCGLVKP
jgi:hypothetical protein